MENDELKKTQLLVQILVIVAGMPSAHLEMNWYSNSTARM